jgi:hypothetical protein
MNPIHDYLKMNGPSLTSEIADHLVHSCGLTPEAARKRVSRTKDPIKRLAYITFPRKARFVYLTEQFGSPRYWDNLIKALQATKSAYGYAIAALRARGGIVQEKYFPIICGAPIKQSRHLSPETIMNRLTQAGLFKKRDVLGAGPCVCLVQDEGFYDGMALRLKANSITEGILLTAVRDWVRKLGLVSYERVNVRGGDTLPMVGTFAWDMTAPSYLGPLSRVAKDGKAKPGFFVTDVFLGEELASLGVEPFVKKCLTLRTLRNVGPCMQMFVAERYSADAFQILKRHGIIPATPRSLFGEEVAEALTQVTSVLLNAARWQIEPERLDEIFRRLGQIEGASVQLRGTLLEFMVAGHWRRLSDHVWMNRILKARGRKAEADVIAVSDESWINFIECKGYSPYATIPHAQVKDWLQKRVPILYQAACEHPDWQNLQVRFEFWASGQLTSESLELVETARKTIKPERYSIALLQGPEILSAFGRDGSLADAFRKHFMRIPGEDAHPDDGLGFSLFAVQ